MWCVSTVSKPQTHWQNVEVIAICIGGSRWMRQQQRQQQDKWRVVSFDSALLLYRPVASSKSTLSTHLVQRRMCRQPQACMAPLLAAEPV